MLRPVNTRRFGTAKRGFTTNCFLASALALMPLIAHAAPVITGFTPHSGPVGTSVTVVGTDLGGVTSMQFGPVAVASFTKNATGTELFTKVPAGAVTNKIYVLSPNGNAATADNFTVTTADLPALVANNASTVNEGSAALPGLAEFRVTLSKPSTQTVTVVCHTTNNTALSGSDYTAKTETLTFAPGEISKTVKVNFIGDDTPELNETFFLDLQTPTNATIADSRGVGTLRNDDGPGIIIDNAVPIIEGNSGTTEQRFTVHLSAASTRTITVAWATANDSANLDDYVAASGTLTFAPGETTKLIAVQVKGDTIVELNEVYKVYLFDPAYAVIIDSLGVGSIRNDDGPTLNIFDAVPTNEGPAPGAPAGTHGQTFTVSLSQPSNNTITVHWKTANDSANLDDYVAATGILTFLPGQTSKLIEVQVKGDTIVEPNEAYKVYLFDPAYAVFGDALGIGTIVNDDATPLQVFGDEPSS